MGTSRMWLSLVLTLLYFSGSQGELSRFPKGESIEIQDINSRVRAAEHSYLLINAESNCVESDALYIVYMGHAIPTLEANLLQNSILSGVLGSVSAAEEALVYTYNHGFRGFAAKLSAEQAEQVRSVPSVVSVYLSRSVKLQTTSSYDFLGFSTTAGVWPESNFGENTIVGILDTGIWPELPSFNDDGMPPVPESWEGSCVTAPEFGPDNCNRKLIGAKFFVKGYEAVYGPVTEFRSPRDSFGHGTHTASTAAGRTVSNSSLLGLAEGTATGGGSLSRLAIYKVCWEQDCDSSDILAAFDEGIKDGVNILSLSLGGPPRDYQDDSIAVGAFHAVAKGILVVTSGGNSGPFRGSISNIAPWLLTVAASTIDRQFLATVHLGNGESYEGATINTFNMKAGEMFPLVYGGDIPAENITSDESSICTEDSLDKAAVKGKIVVCYIGGGASDQYIFEAGGAGLIVIAEEYKQIAFTWSIPTSSVDEASADMILSYINSTAAPTARIERTDTVFDEAPAPVAAFFSSRGPNTITPNILKPDITAPGVDILAAWSPIASLTGNENDTRVVDFNIISGTSMSCPHVTGAAAVLKTLHPDWSPAAIKSALMTTATPLNESISDGDLGLSVGSGQINALTFADPGLVYDTTAADYANFLCSLGYTTKQLRLVTGDDSVCPKVTPSVLDLNYPSIFVSSNDSISETVTRTVTNVGPATSVYEVSVVPPAGVEITVTPTVLSFDPSHTERNFTVSIKLDTFTDEFLFGTITWSDGVRVVRSPVGVGPPLEF